MSVLPINKLYVFLCPVTGFPLNLLARYADGSDSGLLAINSPGIKFLAELLSGSEWAAFQEALNKPGEWITV